MGVTPDFKFKVKKKRKTFRSFAFFIYIFYSNVAPASSSNLITSLCWPE